MISYVAENPAWHGRAIEQLFDATFGPGHFAKTAERVREFSYSLPDISRVALKDGRLIGVCRVWPICVGSTPALFLGPVAVDPAFQGEGVGRAVTLASVDAGTRAGYEFACLIGAPAFFGQLGFEVVPPKSVLMPGPQDQSRVMLRRLAATPDAPFPTGHVTYPRDAMRAEATQIAYLQRARQAEVVLSGCL